MKRQNDEANALFGRRLSALMREHDLKKNELARVLGVSESTVGKWTLEKSMPVMGMIQRIANYFNVEISYFLNKDATREGTIPVHLRADTERQTDNVQLVAILIRLKENIDAAFNTAISEALQTENRNAKGA
jgi:transcriptional regulator with XRE-family HTH domain